MKKNIFIAICVLFIVWLLAIANFGSNLVGRDAGTQKVMATSSTQSVTLSANIVEALAFSTTTGGLINFGNINPGVPVCDPTGSAFSVTTSASNGYQMAVSDNVAGVNSAMVNNGSYVPDITATVAAPDLWTGGTVGLGIGLYDGAQKEVAWGAGTTVCDGLNKYAGVPQNATTGHTVTGFSSSADLSSWSWKIGAANTQKTGLYTGMVTFTVCTVLN